VVCVRERESLANADGGESYSTLFQADKVQVAMNWTRNVVYERV
jgi:hypothetical protein